MIRPARPAETSTVDPPGLPYLAYGGRLRQVPEGRLGLVLGRAPEAGADHQARDPETRVAVPDPSGAVSRRNVRVRREGQWLWATLIGTARAEVVDGGRVVAEITEGQPGTPLRDGQQIRLINHATIDVIAEIGPDLRQAGSGAAALAEAIVLCEAGASPSGIYARYRALHNSHASDSTLQRRVGKLADSLEIDKSCRGTGKSKAMLHAIRVRLVMQGRPPA